VCPRTRLRVSGRVGRQHRENRSVSKTAAGRTSKETAGARQEEADMRRRWKPRNRLLVLRLTPIRLMPGPLLQGWMSWTVARLSRAPGTIDFRATTALSPIEVHVSRPDPNCSVSARSRIPELHLRATPQASAEGFRRDSEAHRSLLWTTVRGPATWNRTEHPSACWRRVRGSLSCQDPDIRPRGHANKEVEAYAPYRAVRQGALTSVTAIDRYTRHRTVISSYATGCAAR